jgi:Fungal N-terminal domain of STAND proteins
MAPSIPVTSQPHSNFIHLFEQGSFVQQLERNKFTPPMPVGFGFSVGDFIAALELVGTVIDALRDSGSASAEYRELLRVLYSLEMALIQVKRLEVHESQHAELIALRQAAAQCQQTINDFWDKIKKYQPSLGRNSECSDFHVRTAWTKIKWAVCRRDDLAGFKADLIGHTESINILLAVIQMYSLP